jgi:hemoglobin/transferrin/lactoferrin receptor protein
LFIDPFLLSRAEVVRGPVSTYGSGGLGGVMSFTTVSAKELLKEGKSAGGDVKVGFNSGDNSHRYNARVYGSHGALDLLLAGGYQDYNGIRQPGGTTLTPNSAHGTSGLFKAGMQAGDSLRFELSHKAYSKDAWETNNPQVVIGQVQVAHVRQGETVLNASTLNDLGEKALDVKVYDSRTQTQRDANTTFQIPGGAALPYPYSNYVVRTTGIGAQNTSRLDAESVGNHRLTYGLDMYQDKLNTAQGTAAAPNTPGAAAVNPDGTLEVQGAFVQDEIAVGFWRVIPSVRYDSYSAKPVNTALVANSNSHVSPKLALGWQGVSGLNVYGSYGQAFRAPTVWELYQNSPNPGFRRFAPNPTLQPQTDTTIEFGGHYEKRELSGNDDTLRLHAAIFQAKVKNLIQQVTIAGVAGAFGSTLQNQNVANATKDGAELSGTYQLGLWKVDANYSRIRVKDDATSLNLFSPPDKLVTQVSYALPATDLSLVWGMTAVAAQDYDSTVLRRRSGYAAHDLYASWQAPGQPVRVDFGITNLFDKRYLSYQQSQAQALSAYEMGRSYNLAVTGSF